MDSAGWILIILIIGVVTMLIYLNNRSEPTPAPKPPEPPPSPKPPTPTPEKKEEKKYVTIYEYTSVQHIKKCAYCDGENAYGTKVCRICGNDIDS